MFSLLSLSSELFIPLCVFIWSALFCLPRTKARTLTDWVRFRLFSCSSFVGWICGDQNEVLYNIEDLVLFPDFDFHWTVYSAFFFFFFQTNPVHAQIHIQVKTGPHKALGSTNLIFLPCSVALNWDITKSSPQWVTLDTLYITLYITHSNSGLNIKFLFPPLSFLQLMP